MTLQYVRSKTPIKSGDVVFIRGKSHIIVNTLQPNESLTDGGVLVHSTCDSKFFQVLPPDSIGAEWAQQS